MENLCDAVTGKSYRKVIQALLDGGDVHRTDAQGISPLVWAVVCGSLQTVQVLTAVGAAPNAFGLISLQFLHENACYFLRSELKRVRVFDNPCDLTQQVRCTALHLAVLRGHAEMVAQLVHYGGNPELEMESELSILRGNCRSLVQEFCFETQDECRDALRGKGDLCLSKAGFAAFMYKVGIDRMSTIDAYVSHINNLGLMMTSRHQVFGVQVSAKFVDAVKKACRTPQFAERNTRYRGACLAAVRNYLQYVESFCKL